MKPLDTKHHAGRNLISPYIREGSGLKQHSWANIQGRYNISPYIREGSGLKQQAGDLSHFIEEYLPLHP